MSFLVSNYTDRLNDNESQKYSPEQNFMNLKKTNPNFKYPIPCNITETKENISVTPYEENFLTQKIIKRIWLLWTNWACSKSSGKQTT